MQSIARLEPARVVVWPWVVNSLSATQAWQLTNSKENPLQLRQEAVNFFSEGSKLCGLLRLPDQGSGPFPGIVQGPGWLGLHDAKLYERYHHAFTAAGYAVLVFD